MSMKGWVKFHRRYLESDLWLSESFTKGQAWVDLFSLANHKAKSIWIRGIEINIKRGQLAWSEVSLSQRWTWSRNKVRRFLKWLKMKHQIEQKNTNVTTLISIVNYERYQIDETPNDTPNDTAERQQKDSKRYTNKNEENVNNEEKKRKKIKKKSFSPPTIQEVESYFFENGYTKQSGINAFKYYRDGDPPWTDSKGNKVRGWKQKMRGVWFKDENKRHGTSKIDKEKELSKFRQMTTDDLKKFPENIYAFEILRERGEAID